jgi:hypothetical protein
MKQYDAKSAETEKKSCITASSHETDLMQF